MRRKLIRVAGAVTACLGGWATPALASPEWILDRMNSALHADVTWTQVRLQIGQRYQNPPAAWSAPVSVETLARRAPYTE